MLFLLVNDWGTQQSKGRGMEDGTHLIKKRGFSQFKLQYQLSICKSRIRNWLGTFINGQNYQKHRKLFGIT